MYDYYPSGSEFKDKPFTSLDDIEKCLKAWENADHKKRPDLEYNHRMYKFRSEIETYITKKANEELTKTEIDSLIDYIGGQLKERFHNASLASALHTVFLYPALVLQYNRDYARLLLKQKVSTDPLSIDYKTVQFQSYEEIRHHINAWGEYFKNNPRPDLDDSAVINLINPLKIAIKRSIHRMHLNITDDKIDMAIGESRGVFDIWNKLIETITQPRKLPHSESIIQRHVLDRKEIERRLAHKKSMIGKANFITVELDGDTVKFDADEIKTAYELIRAMSNYLDPSSVSPRGTSITFWFPGNEGTIGDYSKNDLPKDIRHFTAFSSVGPAKVIMNAGRSLESQENASDAQKAIYLACAEEAKRICIGELAVNYHNQQQQQAPAKNTTHAVQPQLSKSHLIIAGVGFAGLGASVIVGALTSSTAIAAMIMGSTLTGIVAGSCKAHYTAKAHARVNDHPQAL